MAELEQPGAARTYRAASGRIMLVLAAAFAVFLLGDTMLRGSVIQMLLVAPWVLLALWLIYEASVVSAVRVDADGATVQNMLRRTSFGWSRVRDIDLRWQLVFSLDDGTDVTCFGGPARSRPTRQRVDPDSEAKAPAGIRELTEIRDRWQAASGADAPITRTWDWPALIALGIIAVWAIAALAIAGG